MAWKTWGILAVCMVLLSGCMTTTLSTKPVKQAGDISLQAAHKLVPKDGQLYRIHNIQKPDTDVFLFLSSEDLARCYTALNTGKDAKAMCGPGMIAKVEDGLHVRTIACHQSKFAVCEVQTTNGGEAAGTRGVIMWDWLAPIN